MFIKIWSWIKLNKVESSRINLKQLHLTWFNFKIMCHVEKFFLDYPNELAICLNIWIYISVQIDSLAL